MYLYEYCVKLFRALNLKPEVHRYKSSILPLAGVVLVSPEFNSLQYMQIGNWSASHTSWDSVACKTGVLWASERDKPSSLLTGCVAGYSTAKVIYVFILLIYPIFYRDSFDELLCLQSDDHINNSITCLLDFVTEGREKLLINPCWIYPLDRSFKTRLSTSARNWNQLKNSKKLWTKLEKNLKLSCAGQWSVKVSFSIYNVVIFARHSQLAKQWENRWLIA